MAKPPPPTPRRLFLDDDPARAESFLALHPDAAWVQTVEDCVARLAESWDEIHLDHDLGGETFVDSARDDCGMAVVRWIAAEPREHLHRARFIVHSHNMLAAMEMTQGLRALGFRVETRPFGLEIPEVEFEPAYALPNPWSRALAWFERFRRVSKPEVLAEPAEAETPPRVD